MPEKELNIDLLQENLISFIQKWQNAVSEKRDEDASHYAKKVGNQINEALDDNLSIRLPLESVQIETTNPKFVLKIAKLLSYPETVANPFLTIGGTSFAEERVKFAILPGRDSLIVTTHNQESLFTFKSGDIVAKDVKIR